MKNGGSYDISPPKLSDTNAISGLSIPGSMSYRSTGDASTDLPSIEREGDLLDRIRFLEDDVERMQNEINELKGSEIDDVEVFEIRKVSLKEAKDEIISLLEKKKEKIYLSDIIVETKMDPEKVFKAYQALIKEGKIKRTD